MVGTGAQIPGLLWRGWVQFKVNANDMGSDSVCHPHILRIRFSGVFIDSYFKNKLN